MSKQLKKFEFEFPLLFVTQPQPLGSLIISGVCSKNERGAYVELEHYELGAGTSLTALMTWLETYGTTPIEAAIQSHIEAVMSGQIISKQEPETLEEAA